MSKTILITGHSKGLGKELAEQILSKSDFKLVGIARTSSHIQHPNLTEIHADLSDEEQVFSLHKQLQSFSFDTLILNAGFNTIKPPESYSLQEIQSIIQLNFTSPALLIRMCLNNLLKAKGHIIAIGSYSGTEIKKWNNFYGASKSGLHHLMKNLFEQYRKQGLKVSIVIPDIMDTEFYSHQEYAPEKDVLYALQAKEVAAFISQWILNPPSYVPLEIVLRPQMFQLKKKSSS